MATILSQLTSSPILRQYSAGLAVGMVSPVAEFLAPSVEVATTTGRFKKYFGAEHLTIPETRRAMGGTSAKVTFSATDGTFNVEPHALDFEADQYAVIESAELGLNLLQQGGNVAAQIAALSHEKRVLDLSLTAAGVGTAVNVAAEDPIDAIDTAIKAVGLACGGWGSQMVIRVLVGIGAHQILKNSSFVRSRFVSAGGMAGTSLPQLSEQQLASLLVGSPEVMFNRLVTNTAAAGQTPTLAYMLDTSILVFAAHPSPSQFDPSTFKTFRLMGKWMTPRVYQSSDNRVEYSGWDWAADVQQANTSTGAITRLNLSSTPP